MSALLIVGDGVDVRDSNGVDKDDYGSDEADGGRDCVRTDVDSGEMDICDGDDVNVVDHDGFDRCTKDVVVVVVIVNG